MKPDRRWEELQSRWTRGEALGPEEERERLALGASDPAARRELELYAELRARVEQGDGAPAEALVERVLASVDARPRLRLIGPGAARPEEPPEPPPARSRRWRLGAALGACTALAAGFALVHFRSPEAPQPAAMSAPAPAAAPALARSELVLASGAVTLGDVPARVGAEPLLGGSRIVTGGGRACFTIDPGIDVCVAPESSIVLESLAVNRPRVRVERGKAVAALSPRAAGRSFVLAAGDVLARALGTVFALERAADGASVELVVAEGHVEVESGAGRRESVAPHSRLVVRGSSIERAQIGRGEEARLFALIAPRALWAGSDVGVLEIAGGEPGGVAAIDEQAPLELPLRALVPAGKRHVVVRASGSGEVATVVAVAAGETRRVDARELAPASRASASSAPASASSPAASLDAARRELARGNARGALALYERLRASFPASAEAKTVLVTMGKLELDSKQPERALAHFDAYLRAPGPLAPEAHAGRIRALRALGRASEERAAIERYLARYPNGFEAATFGKRLEALSPP